MSLSPAQKLAKSKPTRKLRSLAVKRQAPWVCLITAMRHDLRISLDDVAKATGISKTALWQIEHGTDPMLTTAHKLAVFFGKTFDQLWSRQMDPVNS